MFIYLVNVPRFLNHGTSKVVICDKQNSSTVSVTLIVELCEKSIVSSALLSLKKYIVFLDLYLILVIPVSIETCEEQNKNAEEKSR